jgi:membrane dipeptidase
VELSQSEALHRSALVIDSHNDAIVSLIRRRNLSLSGGPAPHLEPREGTVLFLRGRLEAEAYAWNGQVTLPKLREGGIDSAFFAVDVTRALKNHLAYALDAFGFFAADLEGLGDRAVVVRSGGEIEAAKREERLGIVLVVENSDALEGSLNILEIFHALGVRSITLTHNPGSLAALGNGETRCGGGLTCFGVRLVEGMNRLGMLVDVSHIAERGFYDVLETTRKPVIASHSCCSALCEHPRNLNDAQLRALAENGGVVGITFVPPFVDPAWREAHWPAVPSVEKLLDHFDHAIQVAGIDHVGIGSDFDGGGTVLSDASDFPRLTEGLLGRGYGEEDVRKVLGLNHLRLLRATIG